MEQHQRPTKGQVRQYLAARQTARKPPPSPQEIRRQLGWQLPDPQAGKAAGE